MPAFFIRHEYTVIATQTELQNKFPNQPSVPSASTLIDIAVMKPKFLCAVLGLLRFQSQPACSFEAAEAFPSLVRDGSLLGKFKMVDG